MNATDNLSWAGNGSVLGLGAKPGNYIGKGMTLTIPTVGMGTFGAGYDFDNLCTQCTDATYSAGGYATSCTACPTTLPVEWRPGSGTGWDSYTDCYVYRNATSISSYCASGQLRRYASSASAWSETATEYTAFRADPGAYVSGSGINMTCAQCGEGEYSAGGDAQFCTACPELTPGFEYTGIAGASSYTQCAQGTNDPSVANPNCMADDTADTVAILQTASSPTRWNGPVLAVGVVAKPGAILDSQFQDGTLIIESGLYSLRSMCTICTGNTYSAGGTATSCTSCNRDYTISGMALTNHDSASDCKITCPGGRYVQTAGDVCVNVGAGYWAPSSTIPQGSVGSRNACASGLTTIGFDAGADEAGDCGRVLNVGDEKIYLRSTKKTTPSLNISINGDVFYGNMSTATKGSLRINSGGTTYSVYDDSM